MAVQPITSKGTIKINKHSLRIVNCLAIHITGTESIKVIGMYKYSMTANSVLKISSKVGGMS